MILPAGYLKDGADVGCLVTKHKEDNLQGVLDYFMVHLW